MRTGPNRGFDHEGFRAFAYAIGRAVLFVAPVVLLFSIYGEQIKGLVGGARRLISGQRARRPSRPFSNA